MKAQINIIKQILAFLLILLWVYAPVSKLMNFHHYQGEMYNQVFTVPVAVVLIYTLPVAELLVAGLLVFDSKKRIGFFLSAVLMSAFTIYVALVAFHYFNKVPCSCGGVIRALGWNLHLFFNLFFLLLSLTGIYITYRERRLTAN